MCQQDWQKKKKKNEKFNYQLQEYKPLGLKLVGDKEEQFTLCPKTRPKYDDNISQDDQIQHPNMANISPEEGNWMVIDLNNLYATAVMNQGMQFYETEDNQRSVLIDDNNDFDKDDWELMVEKQKLKKSNNIFETQQNLFPYPQILLFRHKKENRRKYNQFKMGYYIKFQSNKGYTMNFKKGQCKGDDGKKKDDDNNIDYSNNYDIEVSENKISCQTNTLSYYPIYILPPSYDESVVFVGHEQTIQIMMFSASQFIKNDYIYLGSNFFNDIKNHYTIFEEDLPSYNDAIDCYKGEFLEKIQFQVSYDKFKNPGYLKVKGLKVGKCKIGFLVSRRDQMNVKASFTTWDIEIKEPIIEVRFDQNPYQYQCRYGSPFQFTILSTQNNICKDLEKNNFLYSDDMPENIEWVNPQIDSDNKKFSEDGMVIVNCISRPNSDNNQDPFNLESIFRQNDIQFNVYATDCFRRFKSKIKLIGLKCIFGIEFDQSEIDTVKNRELTYPLGGLNNFKRLEKKTNMMLYQWKDGQCLEFKVAISKDDAHITFIQPPQQSQDSIDTNQPSIELQMHAEYQFIPQQLLDTNSQHEKFYSNVLYSKSVAVCKQKYPQLTNKFSELNAQEDFYYTVGDETYNYQPFHNTRLVRQFNQLSIQELIWSTYDTEIKSNEFKQDPTFQPLIKSNLRVELNFPQNSIKDLVKPDRDMHTWQFNYKFKIKGKDDNQIGWQIFNWHFEKPHIQLLSGDFILDWGDWEWSEHKVIAKFDRQYCQNHIYGDICRVVVTTPDNLPRAEFIFDINYLNTDGVLRFKESPLTREKFCDKLEGIKVFIVLDYEVSSPHSTCKYDCLRSDTFENLWKQRQLTGRKGPRSNEIEFDIIFEKDEVNMVRLAMPPPLALTANQDNTIIKISWSDYVISNKKPNDYSFVENSNLVMTINNEGEMTIDLSKILQKSNSESIQQVKIKYGLNNQNNALDFSVQMLELATFEDQDSCVFKNIDKKHPCIMLVSQNDDKKILKLWQIIKIRGDQKWDYAKVSTNETNNNGIMFDWNLIVNDIGTLKWKDYKDKDSELESKDRPVTNLTIITGVYSNLAGQYLRKPNRFSFVRQMQPHIYFYSLKTTKFSQVLPNDLIIPKGKDYISPFIIYCKTLEGSSDYVYIREQAQKYKYVLDIAEEEPSLQVTAIPFENGYYKMQFLSPTEVGKYKFIFQCYSIFDETLEIDHQSPNCDQTKKICVEQTVHVEVKEVPYLELKTADSDILYQHSINSIPYSINMCGNELNKCLVEMQSVNLDNPQQNQPFITNIYLESDILMVDVKWNLGTTIQQADYIIDYAIYKIGKPYEAYTQTLKIQVKENTVPELKDQNDVEKQILNCFIGVPQDINIVFKDVDTDDYVESIIQTTSNCGYELLKPSFTKENEKSDPATSTSEKDMLKLSWTPPDHFEGRPYTTCEVTVKASDSRRAVGQYSFQLYAQEKVMLEDIPNTTIGFGFTKQIMLAPYVMRGNVKEKRRSQIKLTWEVLSSDPPFNGAITQTKGRHLALTISINKQILLPSQSPPSYTLKVRVHPAGVSNWQTIYDEKTFIVTPIQLSTLTFNTPDTSLKIGTILDNHDLAPSIEGCQWQFKYNFNGFQQTLNGNKVTIDASSSDIAKKFKSSQRNVLSQMEVSCKMEGYQPPYLKTQSWNVQLYFEIEVMSINDMSVKSGYPVTFRPTITSYHHYEMLIHTVNQVVSDPNTQPYNINKDIDSATGGLTILTNKCQQGEYNFIYTVHDPNLSNVDPIQVPFKLTIDQSDVTFDFNMQNSFSENDGLTVYSETSEYLIPGDPFRSITNFVIIDYKNRKDAIDLSSQSSLDAITKGLQDQADQLKTIWLTAQTEATTKAELAALNNSDNDAANASTDAATAEATAKTNYDAALIKVDESKAVEPLPPALIKSNLFMQNPDQMNKIFSIQGISSEDIEVTDCPNMTAKKHTFKLVCSNIPYITSFGQIQIQFQIDNEVKSLPFLLYDVQLSRSQEVDFQLSLEKCETKATLGNLYQCEIGINSLIQGDLIYNLEVIDFDDKKCVIGEVQKIGQYFFEFTVQNIYDQKCEQFSIQGNVKQTIKNSDGIEQTTEQDKQKDIQVTYEEDTKWKNQFVNPIIIDPPQINLKVDIKANHRFASNLPQYQSQVDFFTKFKYKNNMNKKAQIKKDSCSFTDQWPTKKSLFDDGNIRMTDNKPGGQQSKLSWTMHFGRHLGTYSGNIKCILEIEDDTNFSTDINFSFCVVADCTHYPTIIGAITQMDSNPIKSSFNFERNVRKIPVQTKSQMQTGANKVVLEFAVRNFYQKKAIIVINNREYISEIVEIKDVTSSEQTNYFNNFGQYQYVKVELDSSLAIQNEGYFTIINDCNKDSDLTKQGIYTKKKFKQICQRQLVGRVDMFFTTNNSQDKKATQTKPDTINSESQDILHEGQTSYLQVQMNWGDIDYQIGGLSNRICICHYMKTHTSLIDEATDILQVPFIPTDNEGVTGYCLFQSTISFAKIETDDLYRGLCIYLATYTTQDYSHINTYKPSVGTDCLVVDLVTKAMQPDFNTLIQDFPESEQGHQYGGYEVTVHVKRPTKTPKQYQMIDKSKNIRIVVGSVQTVLAFSSSNKYKIVMQAWHGGMFQSKPQIEKSVEVRVALGGGPNAYMQSFYEYTTKEFKKGMYSLDGTIVECEIGHYCNHNIMLSVPTPCPPGTYQDQTGQTSCTPCPINHFCPGMANTNFGTCPGGFICTWPGLAYINEANECPGGFICPEGVSDSNIIKELVSPQAIEDYLSSTNTNQIKGCNNGQFCPRRVASTVTSTKMDMDTSKKQKRMLKCWDAFNCNQKSRYIYGTGQCKKGYYCPTGVEPIIPARISVSCPTGSNNEPGINCSKEGDIDCLDCEYCTMTSPECPCPKGYYCPKGSIQPVGCIPGYYTDEINQKKCKDTQPGHYQDKIESSVQIKCPVGNYCPDSNMIETIQCSIDTYQDEEGQTSCKPCKAGFTCESVGMSVPTQCEQGFICIEGEPRIQCPAGYYCQDSTSNLPNDPLYLDVTGDGGNIIKTNWDKYIVLFKNDQAKLDNFKRCKNIDPTNLLEKDAIRPGDERFEKFDQGGIVDYRCPFQCPPGKFCINGVQIGQDCPRGRYQDKYGQSKCNQCELGYACSEDGIGALTQEFECKKGFICSSLETIDSTQKCPEGFYCLQKTGFKGIEPIICQIGLYCPAGRSQSQFDYSDETSSQYCPPGSYSDVTGLIRCKKCTDGHQCKKCANKLETTYYIGTDPQIMESCITPEPCPEGTYRGSSVTGIECKKCQKGTYQPEKKQIKREACIKCDAGIICNKQGATSMTVVLNDPNADIKICTKGSYCVEGTSLETIEDCPSGTACPEGMKSIDQVNTYYLCPPGRYCPSGTVIDDDIDENKNVISTAQEVYDKCMEEDKESIKNCKIGMKCIQDYFCIAGTKDIIQDNEAKRASRCPDGDISPSGSYREDHCVFEETDEQTDYLKAYGYNQDDFIINLKDDSDLWLEPMEYRDIYFITNDVPSSLLIGEGYSLYVQDMKQDSNTLTPTQFNLVGKELILPVSQANVPYPFIKGFISTTKKANEEAKLPTKKIYLKFRILANTRLKFNLNVAVYNGKLTYKQNAAKWKKSYYLGDKKNATLDKSYLFILYKHTIGPTKTFYQPSNVMITRDTTKTQLNEIKAIEQKVYTDLIITNIPEDFEKMLGNDLKPLQVTRNNYSTDVENLLLSDKSDSKLTSIPFQYIPFISDCDYFGSYMPLWELLYFDKNVTNENPITEKDDDLKKKVNGTCKNLLPENTKPVKYYDISAEPKTDDCNLSVYCRYADKILKAGLDNNKFWFKYNSINKKRLMYISSLKLSKEYLSQYLKQDMPESIKLIPVTINKDQDEDEDASKMRSVPTNVTLELRFQQDDKDTAKILTAELIYSDFKILVDEPALEKFMKDPKFTFTFIYKNMDYFEVLDAFGFDQKLYYALTIFLCFIIFMVIFTIWLYFYKNSKVVPRPLLKVKVYFENSKKSFIGLVMSVIPIFIMYEFSHWLVYDEKGCTLNGIATNCLVANFIGDYNDKENETQDFQTKIKYGRMGLCLFMTGIFVIYKTITLMMPDTDPKFLSDRRKCTIVKANVENNQKKAFLYYSVLLTVTFCSIFKQATNSPQVSKMAPADVLIYAVVSGIILAGVNKSFNDDLMVLPLKGTFQIVNLMIALKIGKFRDFLQGYAIQCFIQISVKNIVKPQRINIQDFVAKIKKQRGLKSAQDLTLALSRSRRIYQEQLKDLGLQSMEFLGTWVFPILMIFQMWSKDELLLLLDKDTLKQFVVFTFIQASSEILYDIYINNGIECMTGRRVAELLVECEDVFQFRTKLWCLSDKSKLPDLFTPVPIQAISLQKMGFSIQYFFMNTLGILGMILMLYGIDFWVNCGYQPFRDQAFIFIVFIIQTMSILLQYIIIYLGKHFQIWQVDFDQINKIIAKRSKEDEIDLNIETQILNIYFQMDDKIKKQKRNIAINYIVTELIHTNYNENIPKEKRYYNLMKIFTKIEKFIDEQQKELTQNNINVGIKKTDKQLELKRQEIANEEQLKIRTDVISKKNLLKKSFNDACLIDFNQLNLRKNPLVQLKTFENDDDIAVKPEGQENMIVLSNKERRQKASKEIRKKEVIHRKLFNAKQNDHKFQNFQEHFE